MGKWGNIVLLKNYSSMSLSQKSLNKKNNKEWKPILEINYT